MPDHQSSNRLRCYCDGELSHAERAEVEQRLECCARDREVVAFERTLRQRVAQSMADPVPGELEAKVRSALCGGVAGRIDPLERGQPDAAASSTDGRWREFLAGPRRANIFAVAASLALVAGAVLVGIYGQPIDKLQPGQRIDAAREAASFASMEHTRCAASDEARSEKLLDHDPALASQSLSDFLDAPLQTSDLTGIGYEFVGAGACHVPGFERSVHLFYRRIRPDGAAMFLSLFVGRPDGPFLIRAGPSAIELRPGAVHPFPLASTCREGRIWTDGQTIRMLVCCNTADLPKALQLLNPAADDAK